MALSDPQSLTIGSDTYSLPRVSVLERGSIFALSDGDIQFKVSHQKGKRNRSVVRIDETIIAADPLVPTTNYATSMSVQLVVDTPLIGFDVATRKAVVDALVAWLSASSGANLTKVLGGES
jgi:hypothetical protein